MNPLRRLTEALFDPGTPDELVRLTEDSPQPTTEDWFWGRSSTTGTDEDYFWRRLSDNWTHKDVLPGTYLEIHNQVFEAYNANPFANAIIEMGVNFVLGEGLKIDAQNKKVQRVIDAFWNDADNRMNLRQYELVTELALYGEIFVRFFVNPYSGATKIALLDPSLVDDIECDPENIERQLRVHRRPLAYSSTATGIPGSADPQTQTQTDPRFTEGVWYTIPDQVMHFAINKVSNAKRGKSDLATLLPWLRRYKDWLIDRVRINKYKAAFLWDVKLSGANRDTIQQKMNEYAIPPQPGSVLVHNESEEWSAVQPKIDAANVAADGHAIKLMVALGAGIPEHYLSAGGDVNRATAAEMDLPTVKRFQRRQDYVGYMLHAILDRAIAEAQKAGTLPAGVDTTYEIRFPQLLKEDTLTLASGALKIALAIGKARDGNLISHETAVRLFLDFAKEDIDPNEELERLAKDPTAGQPSPTTTPGAPPIAPNTQPTHISRFQQRAPTEKAQPSPTDASPERDRATT